MGIASLNPSYVLADSCRGQQSMDRTTRRMALTSLRWPQITSGWIAILLSANRFFLLGARQIGFDTDHAMREATTRTVVS